MRPKVPEAPTLNQAAAVVAAQDRFSGLNAGITFAAVHDSSIGWYNVETPVASFSFSQRYSADASVSIYPYRLTQSSSTTSNGSRLIYEGAALGDTLLGAHATFAPRTFFTTSSLSMTLPTGDRDKGLGTGRVTFNFDQRIERYSGRIGLIVDAGAGNSAGLTNRLVTEQNNSLGPLAQFQTGFVVFLPQSMSFQSLAYEQLPIGDQKNYTTLSRPGLPNLSVVSGRRVFEDNGFNTSFYVPLSSHFTLSGSYNRSLRLHLDSVSTGITYVWRGTPIRRRMSLIDKAMGEAESGNYLPVPNPK